MFKTVIDAGDSMLMQGPWGCTSHTEEVVYYEDLFNTSHWLVAAFSHFSAFILFFAETNSPKVSRP